MKILIDNGHGIDTPGKRSPNGELREYKYCRKIASSLVGALREIGYDADLVVPEDEDISLKTRVKRVNSVCSEYGKENVLFISIHCNAAPPNDGLWHRARGWSAFTTKGETDSDTLAEALYVEAEKVFTPEKGVRVRYYKRTPKEADWEENFYVLWNTKCAAVLTENFFMDNKSDVKYMLSKDGIHDIVQVHLRGIESYLRK